MYSLRLKRVTPSRVSSSVWTGFTLPRTAPAEIRTAAVQKSALTMLGRRGKTWSQSRHCWGVSAGAGESRAGGTGAEPAAWTLRPTAPGR